MHKTLSIDSATGLLIGVRQVLSPHADERPPGVKPSLLVVHGISLPPGEFGGPWIDRLFTGNLPAGAHPAFAAPVSFRPQQGWHRLSFHLQKADAAGEVLGVPPPISSMHSHSAGRASLSR